jgi:hypothetical protein
LAELKFMVYKIKGHDALKIIERQKSCTKRLRTTNKHRDRKARDVKNSIKI